MKGLPATFAASEKPSSSRCKTTTRMVWRSISAITWYQNGFSLPHMWVGRAGSFSPVPDQRKRPSSTLPSAREKYPAPGDMEGKNRGNAPCHLHPPYISLSIILAERTM
jgi:hypothetical protein